MSDPVSAEFEALIQNNPLVFIDFWAPWCAPCKQFSTIYEQVAGHFPDIQFIKVNIEKQKDLIEFLGIRSIPHLMAIKEGVVIYSDSGSISETTLMSLAKQMQQIDISHLKIPK